MLERKDRANLVYRNFKRVGASNPPDAKTMGRWGLALGQKGVEKIQEQGVEIALPTNGSLLGDGLHVWIRAMMRVGKIAEE